MKPLRAFHNDPKIKAKYLRRVRAHQKADEIINGKYWESGRGCAVGCTIHSDNHAAYETELGIPRILARLEDRIFEALYKVDASRAKKWPELFLSSIKTGRTLELVWPKFAHWMLADPEHGVSRLAKSEPTKEVTQRVVVLYERCINGDKPSAWEWRAAAADAAADAAAAAAADHAVDYTVAYTAAVDYTADYDAAYAADYAADYAAAAAAADYTAAYTAAAAAAAAARYKYYGIMADKLIELLKTA